MPRNKILKFYTDFPFDSYDTLADFAMQAQLTGYSGIFSTENRHDPFLPIAASARREQTISMGTGVAMILARSPFVIAQSAWDLHFNTGEKFILGVGTQTDEHLRFRYSVDPFDKHVKLLEAIRCVREIWASWKEDREPVYLGKYYKIKNCPEGFRPTTSLQTLPKIYILCSSLKDFEVARRAADGIITHPMWSRRFIAKILNENCGSEKCEIVCGSIIATGTNIGDMHSSRENAKGVIKGYILKAKYDDVFEAIGLENDVSQFRAVISSGGDPWRCEAGVRLYREFVLDVDIGEFASSVVNEFGDIATGVFPNVLSRIPRLLAPEHILAITS